MSSRTKLSLLVLAFAGVSACGPRQVEVRTAPPAPTTAQGNSVQLTNNLSQAINVYVVSPGNELFLRQVAPNTVEKLPVTGVATGTSVTFKAVTVDGSRTYQSRSAPLSPAFLWSVP